MLTSELAIAEVPLLGPASRERERRLQRPAGEGPHVLVIGAGASGIIAAVYLQRAGIPFTIIEKNKGLGGVWFENRYPGCGVDTPSHYYSFSFAPYDWPHYFATRDQLCVYLQEVVETLGIREYIRFDTAAIGVHRHPRH